jgi:di/tricarboxylate transporter
MRLAVPIITALILIVIGAFELLLLPGMNVYGESAWTMILIANSVMVIVTIVVASAVSALLAHVLQKRSGMSPWLVGPLVVVAVSAVAIVFMSLSVSILTSVIGAARQSPAPPPRQPPAANRRGGGVR